MRDGDIFRWSWKPELGREDYGPYGDYHCTSQFAVFENGVLRDTFWGLGMDARRLDRDQVVLRHLGNRYDMTKIESWEIPYYRREDIVDTRHSNDSRAPIYLKSGAQKSADAMLKHAHEKLAEAEREKEFQERQMERYSTDISNIENGDLDAVHF